MHQKWSQTKDHLMKETQRKKTNHKIINQKARDGNGPNSIPQSFTCCKVEMMRQHRIHIAG